LRTGEYLQLRGRREEGLEKITFAELHNFNFSPNIVRMIKSRRMRWAGHIARMREMINAYKDFI
jgi:hypothetical protein